MPGRRQAPKSSKTQVADLWGDRGAAQPKARKRRRAEPLLSVRALEVDTPGCSYNPDADAHEDAIAEAVAAVVGGAHVTELQPRPRPLRIVDAPMEVDPISALLVRPGSSDAFLIYFHKH